jgi:hypothetical protein
MQIACGDDLEPLHEMYPMLVNLVQTFGMRFLFCVIFGFQITLRQG